MTLFFVFAALLVIAVLVLLLPVVARPSHRVDQVQQEDVNVSIARRTASELKKRLQAGELTDEEYESEQTRLASELARDLSEDTSNSQVQNGSVKGAWLLWPIAAGIPIMAGALYIKLGNPQAFDPANYVVAQNKFHNSSQTTPQGNNQGEATGGTPQEAPDMQEIVAGINAHLEENPEDARAWFMLGRAHLSLGEYEQATTVLRKSLEIEPANIDAKLRLADAIGLTQQGDLAGEPVKLLEDILQQQPNHPQGLWLYGIALEQRGDKEQAVATWQKLLPVIQTDARATSEVKQLIASAGGQPADIATTATTNTEPPVNDNDAVAARLNVEVSVAAGLADGLDGGTAVFVYAKAMNGPPMPLAVQRLSLSDLPATVELSDAQAMMASMKLSAFANVAIGARISATGDAIAKPGDLYAEISDINTKKQTAPLQIVISDTWK